MFIIQILNSQFSILNSQLSTLNSQLKIITILELPIPNAKRDILHIMATDILLVLLCGDPDRLLQESYGFLVAAAAYRVDDDDVRRGAVGLHHEVQPYGALYLAFFGFGGEFQVRGDVFGHVRAVGEIRAGHLIQLFVFKNFV